MRNAAIAVIAAFMFATAARSADFHVALNGNNSNPGTQAAPLRTIQRAAELAQSGDVIIVHEGVYRERINPPGGGMSENQRIVYEAAPGEKPVIKGSEEIKNWARTEGDVWKVTLPNSFFGGFNPYSDLIHGDWFNPKGRNHHTGAVYLNGVWLAEAATLDDLKKSTAGTALWFGEVDKGNTTIWAQFIGLDPNRQEVEINVRQAVFYPEKTGIDYITVRGFTMEDAATPWAPPTAEQIGLIGTHWSKGWIIENNVIRNSTCSGISLGKYGDQWDNTSANSAEGYVKTIERALASGWSRDNIGHHVVRNNTISNCEQAGIVGSLGAAFSTITGNTIHDIHVRRLLTGAEMAGIKFHGAVDTQIFGNHIYRTCRGLWLDWMAQGTRISGNLFNDNDEDVFVEVDHGPFLFDNNLFLSPIALRDSSQGGAYVHNLFTGTLDLLFFDSRQTPFLKAHSTALGGFHDNPLGDDRYYNNLIGTADLSVYDRAQLPSAMDGNVFLQGAKPSKMEVRPVTEPDSSAAMTLVGKDDGLYLRIGFDKSWTDRRTRKLVTTEMLGKSAIPDLQFEQPDGLPVSIDTDYLGKTRNKSNPTPGPFEQPGEKVVQLKVWRN